MLKVVFNDDNLVIIEKPAGMPCHPLKEGGLPNSALEEIIKIYLQVAHT